MTGMPGKGSGARELKVRVKTGKGRKLSSKLWLDRQLNDPYVARAKREGMRSRAAYKLSEIDDKVHFLKKGSRVVDLGAAAGVRSRPSASTHRSRAASSPSTFCRSILCRAWNFHSSIFSIQRRPTNSRLCWAV